MRRSDLILYLGILMLVLGLLSWLVTKDRPGRAPLPTDTQPADTIPEIPESPEDATETAGTGADGGGLLAFARDQVEALLREGDRLVHRFWKDGLSDGQRNWLTGFGAWFSRLKDFTLSLQFLLILVSTALLVGIYHMVSSGKLQRLIRKSDRPVKS